MTKLKKKIQAIVEWMLLWALLLGGLALICSLLAGCSGSNKIVIERTEPSGAYPEQTLVLPAKRPPKLKAIELAGPIISQPVEIRPYTRPVLAPTLDVYEIVIDARTTTIKTTGREIRTLTPAEGEVKTLRPDGRGGIQERVRGVPLIEQIIIPIERDGLFTRLWGRFKWLSMIIFLAGVAGAGIFVYVKFRTGSTDKMMDKVMKLGLLNLLNSLRGK